MSRGPSPRTNLSPIGQYMHGVPPASRTKRLMDSALSWLLLAAFGPVLIIIGAFIFMESPGSILQAEACVGIGRRTFWRYTFRTRRTDDGELGALGGWLERTGIACFPQLLNVLVGEMSFVGPHPHTVSRSTQLAQWSESYYKRYQARPGIFSACEIESRREERNALKRFYDTLECDISYIEEWSIITDIKTIFVSVCRLF